MTKRIMRAFKMNEISAVDRPAQAGARMTILKRDNSTDNNTHGHERINDMTDAELKKMLDDAVKAALPAAVTAATADLTKKLNETTSQLDAITKAAKKKKPFDDSATDGDPEPDADDMDDSAKKAWRAYVEKRVAKAVAKAKEEHEAEIAKRADVAKNDETLEHDGVVLRKSVIGDDQFKVMKSLTETNEINAFTKRAEAEIPSLPGTSIAKAKALRAVSKLAKEDREVVEAMLKGGNAAMKTQMTALGKDGNGDDTAEGQLEKMVTTYMTTDKTVSKAVAYTKVLETADGKELYAKSLTEKPRAA
jgi:hypothetical protein